MQWLRHAFAVDPPGPAEPTDAQRAIAERLVREIVRRRMSTPALLFLEASRPLNMLGAQALHFLQPLISAVADGDGPRRFAEFLERRGSIDWLCRRIEERESEGMQAVRPHGPDGACGPDGTAHGAGRDRRTPGKHSTGTKDEG